MLNVNLPNSRVGGGKTTKSDIIEALGYEPAGGENLVLDSNITVSNSIYRFHEYISSEKFELKQKYTITVWGDITDDDVDVYLCNGSNGPITRLRKIRDGVYSGIGSISGWNGDVENIRNRLVLYSLQNRLQAVKTNTVYYIKAEKGIVTDPVWSPAPEDVVVRSELDKFFNVPYVDDLLTYASSLPGQNIVHFARTDANTKNTPYSDKITGAREGTAIIIGGKVYSTILFVPIADSTLYTRVCAAGTYGNWYSLTGTERKISSDEPSDDMEIN